MTDKGVESIGAQESVITHRGGCLQCGAELPAPTPMTRVPRKFCRGNKCRSAWHAAQRQRRIDDIDAKLDVIRDLLEAVSTVAKELK